MSSCVPGNCSLREAILEANRTKQAPGTAHRIELPSGRFFVDMPGTDEDLAATGDLDIRRPVVIEGAGAGLTFIRGGSDRVFHIHPGVTAVLAHVTIERGGTPPDGGFRPTLSGGGGILTHGYLGLQYAEVLENRAVSGAGILQDGGTLQIQQSAIGYNFASDDGGGLLVRNGSAAIVATTFVGNHALHGGGLWTAQRVTLNFVTLTQNTGKSGAAIYSTMPHLASLLGTIVDVPSGTACFNTVGSSGFNLDRDGSCGLGSVGDAIALDPMLEPAGRHLRFTPMPGSPAIDSVVLCSAGADQRGVGRPIDGDGDGVARCDMGAVEVSPSLDYADVEVTIPAPATVLAGRVEVWTIRVRNNGPAPVDAVQIDAVPAAGLSDVRWVCAPTVMSGCYTPSGTGNVLTHVWMPPGAELDIFLYGGVPATATEPLTTRATATQVYVASVETNPANNTAENVARVWR